MYQNKDISLVSCKTKNIFSITENLQTVVQLLTPTQGFALLRFPKSMSEISFNIYHKLLCETIGSKPAYICKVIMRFVKFQTRTGLAWELLPKPSHCETSTMPTSYKYIVTAYFSKVTRKIPNATAMFSNCINLIHRRAHKHFNTIRAYLNQRLYYTVFFFYVLYIPLYYCYLHELMKYIHKKYVEIVLVTS